MVVNMIRWHVLIDGVFALAPTIKHFVYNALDYVIDAAQYSSGLALARIS